MHRLHFGVLLAFISSRRQAYTHRQGLQLGRTDLSHRLPVALYAFAKAIAVCGQSKCYRNSWRLPLSNL